MQWEGELSPLAHMAILRRRLTLARRRPRGTAERLFLHLASSGRQSAQFCIRFTIFQRARSPTAKIPASTNGSEASNAGNATISTSIFHHGGILAIGFVIKSRPFVFTLPFSA